MDQVKYQSVSVDTQLPKIDADAARFPCCITWTHLPMLTWMLPTIGHTGVCTTDGIIYDFAGPYTIGKDDFAFGRTYKYL